MTAFTEGLRAYADWLEAHPEMAKSLAGLHNYYVTWDRNEFVSAVKALGGSAAKGTTAKGKDFEVTRDFGGGVRLTVYTRRENVCERVQIGIEAEEVEVDEDAVDPDDTILSKSVVHRATVRRNRPVYEWTCPESILG